MSPDACEQCFYCRMPLGGFHEHDHAPVPARLTVRPAAQSITTGRKRKAS